MPKDAGASTPVSVPLTLGAFAEALKPRELAPERRTLLRTRILARIKDMPAPAGTITIRADEGDWIRIDPLVELKLLRRDYEHNNQTALWRLKPGAVLAPHPHTLEEECMVLEGEIRIGDHAVRAGDMHIAKPGYDHPTLVSEGGALLLVRSEIHAQPGVI